MNLVRPTYILLIIFGLLIAQSNNVKFENISTFSGLSASRTKCLLQDSEGYLWIGTMGGGLNRYDGYSFSVFQSGSDSSSLIHDNVYSLAEDKNGTIWVVTNDGISKYIHNENKFKNYNFREYFDELRELNFHSGYEVFVDSQDRIWVGTSYHGALIFNQHEEKFIPVSQKTGDKIDPFPQVYGDFTEDSDGTIWASAGTAGLVRYYQDEGLFKPAPMEESDRYLLKQKDIFRIYADSENNIWIMTRTDLYKFIPSSKKLLHLKNYSVPNAINDGYEGEMVEDESGNMYVVHINLPSPIVFPAQSNDYQKLSSEEMFATDIYIDSFGIVWVTDWVKGLHKYVPNKQIFNQLTDLDGTFYFSNATINDICIGSQNPDLLFIASEAKEESIIHSLDIKKGKLEKLRAFESAPISMFPNEDGTFWIGFWNDGLIKWNPKNDQIKSYFSNPSDSTNLLGNPIIDLEKDADDNIWIATFKGLYRLSKNGKSLDHVFPLDGVIVKIYFDDDIAWLTTYRRGLYKIDLRTNKVEMFGDSTLNDIEIWDIHKDGEGYIWLATNEGLNRVDLRTNKIDVFKEDEGLASRSISSILVDDNGFIWISTMSGISRVFKDSQNQIHFTNYDARDGISSPNFRLPIKAKDQSGQLFLAGESGLFFFKPKELITGLPILKLVDISVNGNSYLAGKSKNYASNLDLAYNDNTISFSFLAIHFAQPENNRYAYYLEGYDAEWQKTKNRKIQYVNLDPGDYVFRLKAANRDGVWSNDEIRVKVAIAYPWWQTWYAYLGYFLFALSALALIRKSELKRRQESESKKLLEAENSRKTKELEEARQLQLSMLPKELPQLPQLDISVYMQTATEVGGDYYDFHVSLDGTLTVVIGDATGHGMKAGTMVTAAKSLFNSYAPNPDILFSFQEITRCIKQMNFGKLSMCMTMLKIKGDKMQISTAGMPPSFIFRSDTRVVEEHLFKAMPLGTMLKFPYEVKETTLKAGDTVLLMSDGLPELENDAGDMYGYKKVRNGFEDVADNSPEEIISFLKNEGKTWSNDQPPDDDVTFVVIKVK